MRGKRKNTKEGCKEKRQRGVPHFWPMLPEVGILTFPYDDFVRLVS